MKLTHLQIEQHGGEAQIYVCECVVQPPELHEVQWLAAVVYAEAHSHLTEDHEREAIAWTVLNRVRYVQYFQCFKRYFDEHTAQLVADAGMSANEGGLSEIRALMQIFYDTEVGTLLSDPEEDATIYNVTMKPSQFPSVILRTTPEVVYAPKFAAVMSDDGEGGLHMDAERICSSPDFANAEECEALRRAITVAERVHAASAALAATADDPMRIYAGLNAGPPPGIDLVPQTEGDITSSVSEAAGLVMPQLIGFNANDSAPDFVSQQIFDWTRLILYSDGGVESADRGAYRYVYFYRFQGRERSRAQTTPKPVTYARATVFNYDAWPAAALTAAEQVRESVPEDYCLHGTSEEEEDQE